jgi:hypothetical protein
MKRIFGLVVIAVLGTLLVAAGAKTITGKRKIIVRPPSNLSTPPLPAAAVGLIYPAMISDWTGPANYANSIDYNMTNNSDFAWYMVHNGILYMESCQGNGGTTKGDGTGGLKWPVSDQGHQVLSIKYTPTCQGSQQGRIGIISDNSNGGPSVGVTYPPEWAFLCRVRLSVTTKAGHEIDFGRENIMGPWYNCWSWSAVGYGGGVLEEDIYEVHGGTGGGWRGPKPGSLNFGVGGVIDWSRTISKIGSKSNNDVEFETCCGIMGWASKQFNPSTYLSYMAVVTTQGPNRSICSNTKTCLQIDGYLSTDDVNWTWGASAAWNMTAGVGNQRRAAIADVTVGCYGSVNAQEGIGDCLNIGMSNPHNRRGNLAYTIPTLSFQNIAFGTNYNGSYIWVEGMGGNAPDGPYLWNNVSGDGCAPCEFALLHNDGSPVPYTGGYNDKAILNPYRSINMYMQNYRIFTRCANWQTTNCGSL